MKTNLDLITTPMERMQEEKLIEKLRAASKKIAPVWSLTNFVAVNPYLGLTNKKFETVAEELAAAGNVKMTLPTSFYLDKIKTASITKNDIKTVLHKKGYNSNVDEFIKQVERQSTNTTNYPTTPMVADVATKVTGKDWNRFIIGRITIWAASYFDTGQAIWKAANQEQELFLAWKTEAEIALTAELTGVKNFRKIIKKYPNHPIHAAQLALKKLNIPIDAWDAYLHRLLLNIGGWSAYAARLDWESELYGGKDGKLIEFLAILLCWEAALLESFDSPKLKSEWEKAKIEIEKIGLQKEIQDEIVEKLILQEAFEVSAQRKIIEKINHNKTSLIKKTTAKAQAIFCIDVRSETYRRNLELVDQDIETMGFAGFFAFPINYIPLAHSSGDAQCPVLLKTGPTVLEKIGDEKQNKKAINNRIMAREVQKIWKTFKSSAVSCFSFVSPIGLSYLPKLFANSFGWTRAVPHPNTKGIITHKNSKRNISLEVELVQNKTVGIPLNQQIEMGKNALKVMSLTENFSEFVLIVGHGATMVNNPHASGYDCGACGGHSGEANAKVAAEVLNKEAVRIALKEENILIPDHTVFLSCLHDTTTDEIHIFNESAIAPNQLKAFEELKISLHLASKAARTERSIKLPSIDKDNLDQSILYRSKDWSQIRPEWGLAGCSTFVVAPRARTKAINLEGKSFLHSYDWKKDSNFGVLELIMTAPMVVTTWINLQYYGSTVDNKIYGSGNKTLHNITAGIGVLEGYSGDLRQGLPLQAIHDGEKFEHEPLKLKVIIEAPIEEMNKVLEKHPSVKNLCDNGWMFLFAMNEDGKITHQYSNNLEWRHTQTLAA